MDFAVAKIKVDPAFLVTYSVSMGSFNAEVFGVDFDGYGDEAEVVTPGSFQYDEESAARTRERLAREEAEREEQVRAIEARLRALPPGEYYAYQLIQEGETDAVVMPIIARVGRRVRSYVPKYRFG